jgi:hypothetical protein
MSSTIDHEAVRSRCWDLFRTDTWDEQSLAAVAAFTELAAIRPADGELSPTQMFWLYDMSKSKRLSKETLLAIASELRQEIARRRVAREHR